MDDIRYSLIFTPLAAGAACLTLLPLLIRSGILPQDLPNSRSLHLAPVPRSGGIAMMAPILIAGWLGAAPFRVTLACAAFLACISFVDDRRPMPPLIRLVAQMVAAGTLVSNELPNVPFLTSMIVILITVWMTNLYNFMDGSDGLAAGMTVFGFSCYAALAAASGSSAMVLLTASIATCAFAFLLFNFHPARIFMGDAGSVPLGFLAAALGVIGWNGGLWSPLVPVLAFSPFIADASLTLSRRIVAREKFWLPHKNHYYQRVIRMGLGHRRAALTAYALMAAATISAITLQWLPEILQIVLLASWTMFYILLAIGIDRRWRQFQKGIHVSA